MYTSVCVCVCVYTMLVVVREDRGSTVVKALYYKSEGVRSQLVPLESFIDIKSLVLGST